MSTRRWSKFWWADYEKDAELRMCSLSAQGLWMRLLCAMHASERHGYLVLAGAPPTTQEIAKMCGASVSEVTKGLAELKKYHVCSLDTDGFLYSRRLVRDNAEYQQAVENGKRGGNPILTKEDKADVNSGGNPGGLTPSLKIEAEAEAEAEAYPPVAPPSPTRSARGTRLPADWQPGDTERGFAIDMNLDPDLVACAFRDYWHAKAGANGVKLDWPATWRNWCRRENQHRPMPPGFRQPRVIDHDAATLLALANADAENERLYGGLPN